MILLVISSTCLEVQSCDRFAIGGSLGLISETSMYLKAIAKTIDDRHVRLLLSASHTQDRTF